MRTLPVAALAVLLGTACPTANPTTDDTGPEPVDEICTDGVDNDGDGAVDCLDLADCFDSERCSREVDCDNHQDDDFDGSVDCDDSDCAEACTEDCADGIDNDGDGRIDCQDSDCAADVACNPYSYEVDCTDGIDNDGDGGIDCQDYDCFYTYACIETDCDDGIDNDGNGAIDCDDYNCDYDAACQETDCDDGIDNDGNGDIDCDDYDCSYAPNCYESDCGDGVDNDSDGLVDCEDGDCLYAAACDGELNCDDGVDNDADGLIDCDDDDCVGGDCPGLVARVTGGAVQHELTFAITYTYCGGSSPSSYMYGSEMQGAWELDAQDVTGTVQRFESGAVVATCDWGLSDAHHEAVFFRNDYTSSGFTWAPPVRNGFWVDPGCGTSGSAFLPRYLFGQYGTVGAIRANGPAVHSLYDVLSGYIPWYVGSGTTTRSQYTSGYVGTCGYQYGGERGYSIGSLEEGSVWRTAAP